MLDLLAKGKFVLHLHWQPKFVVRNHKLVWKLNDVTKYDWDLELDTAAEEDTKSAHEDDERVLCGGILVLCVHFLKLFN